MFYGLYCSTNDFETSARQNKNHHGQKKGADPWIGYFIIICYFQ